MDPAIELKTKNSKLYNLIEKHPLLVMLTLIHKNL
jgi:hypothetical protein